MDKKENKQYIGTRIAAMLIDHFIMTFIIVLATLVFGSLSFGIYKLWGQTNNNLSGYFPIFLAPLVFLIFSIYLNKDGIQGKSPAKRILGLIVVDMKTEKVASPVKAVIRNITLLFWPIEVIFVFISPERRLGDFIAGTKVIADSEKLQTELRIPSLILSLFIGCLFLIPSIAIQVLITVFNLYDLLG